LAKTGPTEKTLLRSIQRNGCIHLALIDPEKPLESLPETVGELQKFGTTAIMVGGSTVTSSSEIDATVKTIKANSSLPVILFPNGLQGISRFADAIFFMSMLNSSKPQYITGTQAMGAPIVKRFSLEAIPLGYILVGETNTAVSKISGAEKVPYSRPDLAQAYALAAQYLGMRWVYLEAGSGAETPVTAEMVRKVVSSVEIPVIVGGGIREPKQAEELAKSGAKALVTGTVLEIEGTSQVSRIIAALGRE